MRKGKSRGIYDSRSQDFYWADLQPKEFLGRNRTFRGDDQYGQSPASDDIHHSQVPNSTSAALNGNLRSASQEVFRRLEGIDVREGLVAADRLDAGEAQRDALLREGHHAVERRHYALELDP